MRRPAREVALQILFQTEFAPPIRLEDYLSLFGQQVSLSADGLAYARSLTEGVNKEKKEIDRRLQMASQHWRLERMSLVDKNIMRLAIYEMFFASEPLSAGIAINEAVEIAKKYGSQDSASFVNGVLDQIAKSS